MSSSPSSPSSPSELPSREARSPGRGAFLWALLVVVLVALFLIGLALDTALWVLLIAAVLAVAAGFLLGRLLTV
jgi:hypothetical protein